MPTNVIFLIALLVVMAALIIFTFVFVILVDRRLKKEDGGRERKGSTDNGERS